MANVLAQIHKQLLADAHISAPKEENKWNDLTYIRLAEEHERRLAILEPASVKELKLTLNDFERFCNKCLKIKTKSGELLPFLLNEAQRQFADIVLKGLIDGKPVRVIILKARQMGFSTVTEAIIYYLSSLQEAKNAFIVAQDSSASENLYDMFRLYYENIPDNIKPMRKRNNARRLTFENPTIKEDERKKNPGLKSKITVASAENKVLARSETIHYLHASEYAFWPASKKKKHSTSLFAALSKEPGTIGIIESTANGMEDFKQMWDAAEKGENEYTPLFFPWFAMPTYRMPVPDDFELTAEEEELKNLYGVDNEQLQWRRYTIRNDFNGDVRQFRQEYPSIPEEAFLLSGEGVFDNEEIQRKMNRIKKKPDHYDIDIPKKRVSDNKNGKLLIFRLPEKDKRYVIGADTSKGTSKKGDYQAAYVLEWRTGEMCAVLHGHWDTDQYGKRLDILGHFYNTALLAVEDNNTGHSVLNTLENTCQYPLMYIHKQDYGWHTDKASRPIMMSDFKEAIRDELYAVYDVELFKECLTLIDNNGKEEADTGCHDDRIMAYAIALQVRQVAARYFEWYDKRYGGKEESGRPSRKRPSRERR
ncbi:DNA packaging protein [Domibacillus antri]|uniref:DNA packaging protein n=1 Tax=Domibacillus antri TaxID=1714264 RepID=UPI0009FA8E0E|nr:DNA packaging protein [Domibacillus antri]